MRRRFLYPLLLSVFAAALIPSMACVRKREYIPLHKQTLKGSGKIYFVPLGAFSDASVKALVSYYQNKYGLSIETLSHVVLPPDTINPERQQLIAEQAIDIMKRANPEKVNDPQAILIGLTKQDMYIGKYDWRFGFSYREQGKYAVVSSGRMNLGWRNQLASEDQIRSRLRKMVTKNIGVLYYRLEQSDDPRSVMYRSVGGIQELDYMGEEF